MADKSKQEQVIELVKEGKHTREQIKEQVGCTTGSLASYLSTMTNIARFGDAVLCPISDKDGVMSVTTYEEAEAAKAERASGRTAVAAKTPAERLEAANKRVTRCTNALDSAAERASKDDTNRELELRHNLAKINAELADIELARAKDLVNEDDSAAETEVDAEEVPEVEGDDLL